jgi:Tol biopolymer transport system component
MAEEAPVPPDEPDGMAALDRLDSWKEIAAYLRRDAATVRRWEKREGLPVHRHFHDRRDSVYAYRSEIDRWRAGRRGGLVANGLLDGPSASGDEAPLEPGSAAAAVSVGWKRRLRWALSIAILAIALALAARWSRGPAPDPPQLRFSLTPAGGGAFGQLSLSPDGRLLAFTAAAADGREALWIRRLDSLTAQPLEGTSGAVFPFWSPDSQVIGFFADGKLITIPATGGPSRIVCEAPDGRGGSWNPGGDILFSAHRESGLLRVPAAGGVPVPVTAVDTARERGHYWPAFLPDGRHFLFLADSSEPEHHQIYVGELGSARRQPVASVASNAVYSSGHLLFVRDRHLIAQRFDLGQLRLAGEAFVLAENVREPPDEYHRMEFAVSDTGLLAYRTVDLSTRLVWRDRTGRLTDFLTTPALYADPTFSPDERRVAVDIFDPRPSKSAGFGLGGWTSDTWLLDAGTGIGSRLTFDPAADFNPVWSPDGSRVVYSSNRRGRLDLYERSADGNGGETPLLESEAAKHAFTWSPDGRYVLYGHIDPTTQWDVWMTKVGSEEPPVALLRGPFAENQPQISPDGRWIAYTSNESGRTEVYVQSFPALEGKWQISTAGGGDPRWRPDGRELFYIGDDGRLMAVPIRGSQTFEPEPAEALFETGLAPHYGDARNHYDVSRDGRRFLLMAPVNDARSGPFTVVVNWRR